MIENASRWTKGRGCCARVRCGAVRYNTAQDIQRFVPTLSYRCMRRPSHPLQKINKTITSEHPRSLGHINTPNMRFLLSKYRILSQVRHPSYLLLEEPREARQKKKPQSLTQVPDSYSPIRASPHKFLQVLLQTTAAPVAL